MEKFEKIAIVGMGLMGGAVGRALLKLKRGDTNLSAQPDRNVQAGRSFSCPHFAGTVHGVTRTPESAARALEVGAADASGTDLPSGVKGAELVIFGTGVGLIPRLAREAAPHLRKGALLTDVGSTKVEIQRSVREALKGRPDVAYVGSHPLAGSEKSGVGHSEEVALEGRLVVVAADESSPDETVRRIEEFWRALGAKTVRLAPAEHDAILARTSHMPHLVSAAVLKAAGEGGFSFAAGGLRDITRLAAGNPGIWADIVETNRAPVAEALEELSRELSRLARLAGEGGRAEIVEYLEEGKRLREALIERLPPR